MKAPTINDVARVAAVSKKTVSRVINADPAVREETRTKVEEVIKSLGYAPNRHARSLAARRSYLLGVVYDNPNAGYVVDSLQGALRAARARGYEVIVHPCDYASESLVDDIAGFVDQSRVDGVIVLPPVSELASFVTGLHERGIKAVRITGQDDGLPIAQVLYNDEQAIARLTLHLQRLGHQRIGFIGGKQDHSSSMRRYHGFLRAMREADLPHDEALTYWGDYTFNSGQAGAHALLGLQGRPTALLCSNDAMAAGALRVAHELKIPVPDALSITGFDDAAIATQIWPPLTTVYQPVGEMAELAADSLIKLVEGAVSGRAQSVNCDLVRRASTSHADID